MVRLFYWSNLPTLFVVKKNSCTKKVQLKCLTMKSAGIFDLQKCLMLKSTRKKDQYIWRLKLFSTAWTNLWIRTILLFWIPQESTWFQTHWIQDVFQFWFFCFRKLEHGRWNWMNGLNPFWFRFCSIFLFNFCSGPYLHVFTQQF